MDSTPHRLVTETEKWSCGLVAALIGVVAVLLSSTGFAQAQRPTYDEAVERHCLTSAPLGHLSLFLNGGFGSSRFDVKPLVVDGSSGGF